MLKLSRYALLLAVPLFAANANGAPVAYSVNSDSGNLSTEDSLYLIDLASGADQRRGELFTGAETRRDTEGLAFDPDGTLWGIDDQSMTLFPINTEFGSIKFDDEVSVKGLPGGGGNDFGMTFSCDGTLYITSVATQSLYGLDLQGNSQVIGSLGALGENISAIAASGHPTVIYGLGNGQFDTGQTDSPNLYSIDPSTGVATLIGPLGATIGAYNQGGLGFDSNGILWAITDRRIVDGNIANLASQIMTININTGAATLVSSTSEVGFESLAISRPTSCSDGSGSDVDGYERIPTLSFTGRILAVFLLLITGVGILRNRSF